MILTMCNSARSSLSPLLLYSVIFSFEREEYDTDFLTQLSTYQTAPSIDYYPASRLPLRLNYVTELNTVPS